MDLQSFLDIPAHRLTLPPRTRRSRAWRRRERALDSWAAEERERPFTDWGSERQSAVIRFDAWGNEPYPLRMRRRMVEHLVGIHDRWLERVSGFPTRPYVAIWLALPHIYNSQVVLATGSVQEHYETAVHRPGTFDTYATQHAGPPFPYQDHPCDLSRFEWMRQVERTEERLSWFGEKDRPALLRDSVRTETTAEGDTQVTLVSHHWLGRLAPGDRS